MDRKRSRLGLGPEIAESKVEESGIVASKIMTYPLIFTPPPIKLIQYVFEQCELHGGGLSYRYSVPGSNFIVEIFRQDLRDQTNFFLDLVFEDDFIPNDQFVPHGNGRLYTHPRQIVFDVPEGADPTHYESVFLKFLSEYEEIQYVINRFLYFSKFNAEDMRKKLEDRIPFCVTVRLRGERKDRNGSFEILLPENHLLNEGPKSAVRFSTGHHLSPEFRFGVFRMRLKLIMRDESSTKYPSFLAVHKISCRTTLEELAQKVYLKHGLQVVEFRDPFSNWTLAREGDYKKCISDIIFEHHGLATDEKNVCDSAYSRIYDLRTYCIQSSSAAHGDDVALDEAEEVDQQY